MADQWLDPYPGFQYIPQQVSVSAAHQQEKLSACGIDAQLFAGVVDPAFFIGIAIHAGIDSGISAEGNINMLQQIVQHRPVKTDELLDVQGQIVAVDAVPRGHSVRTEVGFYDQRGTLVLSANRTSLKPDPDKAEQRGAGDRPAPVIHDVNLLQSLRSYQLTPEGVKRYSSEGNSIHYEIAAAQKAGFRAPLIGGGQGVHFLTAALWQARTPEQVRMDIYFRRPIFWDEQVTAACLIDPQGGWQAMALLKPDGKIGTELSLQLTD